MIRTVFDNGTLVWSGDEIATLVAAMPDAFQPHLLQPYRDRLRVAKFGLKDTVLAQA